MHPLQRIAAVGAGLVLGVVLACGGAWWAALRAAPAAAASPASAVPPAPSYTAPGTRA